MNNELQISTSHTGVDPALLYPRKNCIAMAHNVLKPCKNIIITMTRSVQPKPHAVAIVRQNGLSSASCRAWVAVTPVSVTADLANPGGG